MIFPAVVSTDGKCLGRIKEAELLGLKEVAFFPTFLNSEQRKKVYRVLESSSIKRIPLVHIRNDFTPSELEFFIKNFQTQTFNIHPHKLNRHLHDLSAFKRMIFVETNFIPLKK